MQLTGCAKDRRSGRSGEEHRNHLAIWQYLNLLRRPHGSTTLAIGVERRGGDAVQRREFQIVVQNVADQKSTVVGTERPRLAKGRTGAHLCQASAIVIHGPNRIGTRGGLESDVIESNEPYLAIRNADAFRVANSIRWPSKRAYVLTATGVLTHCVISTATLITTNVGKQESALRRLRHLDDLLHAAIVGNEIVGNHRAIKGIERPDLVRGCIRNQQHRLRLRQGRNCHERNARGHEHGSGASHGDQHGNIVTNYA